MSQKKSNNQKDSAKWWEQPLIETAESAAQVVEETPQGEEPPIPREPGPPTHAYQAPEPERASAASSHPYPTLARQGYGWAFAGSVNPAVPSHHQQSRNPVEEPQGPNAEEEKPEEGSARKKRGRPKKNQDGEAKNWGGGGLIVQFGVKHWG